MYALRAVLKLAGCIGALRCDCGVFVWSVPSRNMAFVTAFGLPRSRARGSRAMCPVRMASDLPPKPKPDVSNEGPQPGKKLVRNKAEFAEAAPGDMVGGGVVGAGMGPRRGNKEKKVTKAAAIQKSQTFADAWAEQNEGKVDVWLIIGLITLLTPLISTLS